MNRKKAALAVAAAGTATGVVGLVLLATPAGAGEAPPALPANSAEALVQSVLGAQVPAMSGAVELQNNLGLPIPGLPQVGGNGEAARIYADGQGRGRVTLNSRGSEKTIVEDGSTLWVWDSADRTVAKTATPGGLQDSAPAEGKLADPAGAAKELVSLMQKDSTVQVDGTARVAGRPVYQLVLTPKPTERTLLREVRVAVDSETRLPLRLEVLANGQSEPALRVGFTEFAPGAQDAGLFQFTPPAGATVTESKAGDHKPDVAKGGDWFDKLDAKVVGEGWDTVLVAKLPADLLAGGVPSGREGGPQGNPLAMVKQFGKPVSGAYGSGTLITTKVGTALVTDDGRVALGAVPEQVLADALAQK